MLYGAEWWQRGMVSGTSVSLGGLLGEYEERLALCLHWLYSLTQVSIVTVHRSSVVISTGYLSNRHSLSALLPSEEGIKKSLVGTNVASY